MRYDEHLQRFKYDTKTYQHKIARKDMLLEEQYVLHVLWKSIFLQECKLIKNFWDKLLTILHSVSCVYGLVFSLSRTKFSIKKFED